jgi:hypothetical protein
MCIDLDDVCDEFEAAWASGQEPQLDGYLGRVPSARQRSLAIELVEIDILRRWGHEDHSRRRSLPHYQNELASCLLEERDLQRLIECEYQARLEAGDNPKSTNFEQYGISTSVIKTAIRNVRESVSWPVLRIVSNGETLIEIPLDLPVEVGRQRAQDPPPYKVVECNSHRRVVITRSSDASLSRHQLRVETHGLTKVALQNTSRNRAVGLRGGEPLAAGDELVRALPVIIPLADQSIILTAKP